MTEPGALSGFTGEPPEQLALLRAVCSEMPVPVRLFDGQGVEVYLNPLAGSLTAADQAVLGAAVREGLSGRRGAVRMEGPPAHELTVAPLRNPSGGICAVLAVGAPPSSATEDLMRERESRVAAEAANRVKDEFLAMVSHELRTPLNAMLGWANALRNKKVDPRSMDKALESIERNALAQARLVDDLLDLGRIISGKMLLTLNPQPLTPILLSALEVVRPMADARLIELVAGLDEAEVWIQADENRLRQVFWNLLVNAVKFTPKQGRVAITSRVSDSEVQVSVEDTGAGLPASFLPQLFRRFAQVDHSSTRSNGGLGIGLSLVRHLVELHGGTVNGTSPGEGKGSTFTVTLPRVSAATRSTE